MGELSGTWDSKYTYSGGEGHHRVKLHDPNGSISVESLPNEERSKLSMEQTRDESALSGTWRESTSPMGEYKGAVFDGFVAFILDATGTKADGQWIGYNRDRTKINTGNWILEKEQ